MATDPAHRAISEFRAEVPAALPVYVAIGVFDGVHCGHQVLLRRLAEDAAADGAVSCVMTFDPHPLTVVGPGTAPPLLTTVTDRVRLIRELGVDHVMVVPFTAEFASREPESFVSDILVRALGIRRIYVGFSFTFGRGGRGNPQLLRTLGGRFGFQVEEFEPVAATATRQEREALSSTQIRQALASSAVEEAWRGLGRPHMVQGVVETGDRRGHRLGFPTANLRDDGTILWPDNGVYTVCTCLDGQLRAGVANVGVRPTVSALGVRLLEVHLLDFTGELYGRWMRVAFLGHLRPERRFPDLEALKAQIDTDVATARYRLDQTLSRVPSRYICWPCP